MTDNDMQPTVSRRTALTGAGLILATAMARPAAAAMSAAETANIKVVADFLKGWAAADTTGAKLAALMTDDGEFRYERKAPVVGKAALTAAFDAYLAGGKRYEMKPLETHAKGPVVVHFRHETPVTDGQAGQAETLMGLFILAGGKIKIWENFLAET
ncbi:MAG: nuclear transport factor 2 family protein [Rhodospirillaceae bacterium]